MVVTSDRNFIRLNNKDFYHLLDKTQTAIGEKSGPIRILSFSFVLPSIDPLLALQTLESHAHSRVHPRVQTHAPSPAPSPVSSPAPSPVSSHAQSHAPSPAPSHVSSHAQSHAPSPAQSHAPSPAPTRVPSAVPSAVPIAGSSPVPGHDLGREGQGAPDPFPHFYWEWNGDLDRSDQPSTALLAVGHTAQVEFQGEQRFQHSRQFAEQCFSQTVQIHCDSRTDSSLAACADPRTPGSADSPADPRRAAGFLPFGGPHLFCSFTFFDQQSTPAPFAPATLFLPRWHLARHGSHSVLVVNCLWSLEVNGEGSRDPTLEALCRSVWQAVAPLQVPGADLSALLALPALGRAPLVWPNAVYSPDSYPVPYAAPVAPVPPAPNTASPNPIARTQPPASQHHFKQAVQESLEAIAAGTLGKIVLAHTLEVTSPQPFQVAASLRNLRHLHPDCYCFSVGNGQGQTFLGASPERLLRIVGGDLQTEALAGSAPRGCTAREDEQLARSLLQNPKERHEHQLVAEFILEQLQNLGLNPQAIAVPRLRQLANIQHLLTPIQATLPPQVHPLDLVAQLHPTPAVAGVPRQEACDQIRRWELFDRSLYAAPLGWLDHRGNCEFIVGIRSALLDGDRAWLFAGAGVVSGSDPDRELTEVELKFQTLLSALV